MIYCDGCGEDVPDEDSWWCKICSNTGQLQEVEVPVLIYDGVGAETEIVERYEVMDVCLNCCRGHNYGGDGNGQ